MGAGRGSSLNRGPAKLWRTLALVAVALGAQAAIVALAPDGRAQTKPPQVVKLRSVGITATANVTKGDLWEPSFVVETTCLTCTTPVNATLLGRVEDGARYFNVFSNVGDSFIDPRQGSYTLTVSALPPGFPLHVQETLGIDRGGVISEAIRMNIGDLPTLGFSTPVLSMDEPSDVQLAFRRPVIAASNVISSVWTVSPAAGTAVTDTIVLGTVDGGRYRSVVSNRGVCQSVLANFNCQFDAVAPGLPPVVISATVESAQPGRVREVIRVDTFGDDLIYSATTNVLPSDVEPLELVLDVGPFSRRNLVILQRPLTFFTILSTPLLEVGEEIDRSTIRFGRTGFEDSVGFCFRFDIGRDGLRDLFCIALTERTGFQPGDTEAVVTGKTFDGEEARGTTFIQTIPPGPQVTGS